MNFVNSLNLFGTEAQQIPTIIFHGAPTTSTEGAIGCLGMDVDSVSHDLYKCVAVTDGVYAWKKVSNNDELVGISYDDTATKIKINGFKGCNFNSNCAVNEFASATNLSSRHYPSLSPRQIKYTLNRSCTDFYIYNDSIYTVVNGILKKDNRDALTLAASTTEKRCFSVVGKSLVVFPDKQFYNIESKASGSLVATYTGTCSFNNNSITATDIDFTTLFKPGDGVIISGSSKNDNTYIIREVSTNSLVFNSNIFTQENNVANVTIERTMPNLKFTFECNNRLWGIYKNAIYASALGDPTNFNRFEGLSTDSYFKEFFSAGDFTGAGALDGTPVFFKENAIYRIHGTAPTDFQIECQTAPGVSYGCDKTIANMGGKLVYASHDGIYAYDGSYPIKISQQLGGFRPGSGCASSDGVRYYVSVSDFKGVLSGITALISKLNEHITYVYNSETKTWHKLDDDTRITRIEYGNYGTSQDKPNVFALDNQGNLFTINDTIAGTPSTSFFYDDYEMVESEGITGFFCPDETSVLGHANLLAALSPNSRLAISVSFDNGEFIKSYEVVADENGIEESVFEFDFPQNPFNLLRFKFEGYGDFTLHHLWFEYEMEAPGVNPGNGITEDRVNELIAEALANIPTAEAMTFELEG